MTTREKRAYTKFAQEVGAANDQKFVQSHMEILESGTSTGGVVYVMFRDTTTGKQWHCHRLEDGTLDLNEDSTAETTVDSAKEKLATEELAPVAEPSEKSEQVESDEHPKIAPLTIQEKIILACIPFSKDYEDGFDSAIWLDTLYTKVRELTKMGSKSFDNIMNHLITDGYITPMSKEDSTKTNPSVVLSRLAQQWMLSQDTAPDYNGEYDSEDYDKLRNIVDGLIMKLKIRKGMVDKKPVDHSTAENHESDEKPTHDDKSHTPKKEHRASAKKAIKKPAKKSIARTQTIPELKPGEALLKAFTGMIIGVFKVVKHTSEYIEVETTKGVLKFDTNTLRQIGAKNPKFANKIVLGGD